MLYKRGKTWWIKYYRNGKPYFESTKTTRKMTAKKLLDQREGEIGQGKMPGIYFDKITFDELAEDYITDCMFKGNKTVKASERYVRLHLGPFFGGEKASTISTAKVKAYIAHRIEAEATNATINRELAALKRMFRLGARCTDSPGDPA